MVGARGRLGQAMRSEDLDHRELLELDPEGGTIRFAGQRALLFDAVAVGLLRKYLIENFGFTAARTILTQFGFAHGWRMAEALLAQFTWDSDADWARAGTHIQMLGGLFRTPPGREGVDEDGGVTLVDSFEAEQHVLHLGRADVPMCWTICGVISGYLSRASGKEIFALESRCQAMGDAACGISAHSRERWGDAHAGELKFFRAQGLSECLEVSLERVTIASFS